MSVSSVIIRCRREIEVGGKTYVRGAELPVGTTFEQKCAKCAGSVLGKCCFGFDCMVVDAVYWVEKSGDAPEADEPVRLVTCPKCGKRRKSNRMSEVVLAGGATESWCAECLDAHAGICERCGGACESSSLSEVGGSAHWCPKCAAERAVRCEHCGRLEDSAMSADVRVGSGVVKWCRTCRTESATQCRHCQNIVPTGNSRRVDGEVWCCVCVAEHTAPCSNCGAPTRRGAVGAPVLCQNCVSSRTRGIILGYHGFGGELLFHGGERGRELFLGFELEAGGASETQAANASLQVHNIDPAREHYHVERDGSIPAYGFELVSAPHTLAAHKEFGWDRVVSAMSGGGLKSHDCGGQCGLHVHVSRSFLTQNDRINIDAFVLRNKTFWERVARRTQSDYAKYYVKPDSDMGRSPERYCAVNFRPSETVEFRLFRGTLKFATLMATLEIVDALCRWVKTRTVDQILRNEGEVDNFVAWMAGDATRAATYAGAIKYIADRRAVTDANSGSSDPSAPEL